MRTRDARAQRSCKDERFVYSRARQLRSIGWNKDVLVHGLALGYAAWAPTNRPPSFRVANAGMLGAQAAMGLIWVNLLRAAIRFNTPICRSCSVPSQELTEDEE